MATKEERLRTLEQKQAQINKQIQALKARDAAQERKNDTRRKVIIGGVVQKLIKDGALPQAQLDKWLNLTLKADRDRALFGLAPLAASPALSPTGEAGGAVSSAKQGVRPPAASVGQAGT